MTNEKRFENEFYRLKPFLEFSKPKRSGECFLLTVSSFPLLCILLLASQTKWVLIKAVSVLHLQIA